MAEFDNILLITSEDYETLKSGQTITRGGVTYTFMDGTIYLTDKISSELVDDANSTKKFTTAVKIAYWDAKQEALVSGTNIKTVAGASLLRAGSDPTDVAVITSIKLNNVPYTASGYAINLIADNAPTTDSANLITSGAVAAAMTALEEIAAGRAKAYAISYAGAGTDNSKFNSTDNAISGISSIVDTAGNTITVSSTTFKTGDIVYVTETDVPDRWYNSADGKFYKMESAKMSDFATVTYVDNKAYLKTVTNPSAGAAGTIQFVVSDTDIAQADRVANTLYIITLAN